MSPNDFDPAAALETVRATRDAVGDRLPLPWTYDLAYGLLCGGLVASQAIPAPFSTIAVAMVLLFIGLYTAKFKRRTGVWVNGFSPRRARWVAAALAAWLLSAILGGLWIARTFDLWWAPLAAAVISVPVSVLFSRWWGSAYRAELRSVG